MSRPSYREGWRVSKLEQRRAICRWFRRIEDVAIQVEECGLTEWDSYGGRHETILLIEAPDEEGGNYCALHRKVDAQVLIAEDKNSEKYGDCGSDLLPL